MDDVDATMIAEHGDEAWIEACLQNSFGALLRNSYSVTMTNTYASKDSIGWNLVDIDVD